MTRLYRIGEVATATRVSVRTLRHYDRIGLLSPSAYSEGNQRLYGARELLTLQQILTLRYLGFSLKQIGALLRRPELDLAASMRAQRQAVQERIASLERIDAALGQLSERHGAAGAWDWQAAVNAVAAAQRGLDERSEQMEKMEARYTPEQIAEFVELAHTVGVEEREQIEQAWSALVPEVRASHHLDPTSVEAQRLAERWNELTATTMRHYAGHEQLKEAIRHNYERDAFSEAPGAPSKEDFAFIARVNAAPESGNAT